MKISDIFFFKRNKLVIFIVLLFNIYIDKGQRINDFNTYYYDKLQLRNNNINKIKNLIKFKVIYIFINELFNK